MILKILGYVLSPAIVLYVVVSYIPQLGFSLIWDGGRDWSLFFLISFLFGLMEGMVKSIFNLILLPLKVLSLGMLTIPLNILLSLGIVYLFQYVVADLNLGVVVVLGSIIQVFFFSLITGFLSWMVSKILG